MSVQSVRLVKQTAQGLINELRALEDTAREQTRTVMAMSGPSAAEEAEARLRASLEDTARPALRRIATRESHYPHVLMELADLADRKAGQVAAAFAKHIPTVAATAEFMQTLVHGVIARQSEIDAELARRSTGWALDRQAAVDRNILRIAAFEILYLPDIPNGVSINEAVELAKKYSTAESGRFVNGVLGALAGGEKET